MGVASLAPSAEQATESDAAAFKNNQANPPSREPKTPPPPAAMIFVPSEEQATDRQNSTGAGVCVQVCADTTWAPHNKAVTQMTNHPDDLVFIKADSEFRVSINAD
jgi:hypothetical protein